MPRMNTPQKLDWIHSAIQEAQNGNLDQLAHALGMVEDIREPYLHSGPGKLLKTRTFGALRASDRVLSLIDMRRGSGDGTLGIKAEVAAIIDQDTGSHRKTLALDAIANDAEKWLDLDLKMGAEEFVKCLRDTAHKALRGETTPATPPAPELLDSLRKMVAMARHAPLVGHEYDGGDIDEAEAQITKAEKSGAHAWFKLNLNAGGTSDANRDPRLDERAILTQQRVYPPEPELLEAAKMAEGALSSFADRGNSDIVPIVKFLRDEIAKAETA